MYEEEIHFGKLLLKQSEIVLEHLMLVTFDPVTQESIGFLCYPEWMCEPRLMKVGKGIPELLIGNGFGTFNPTDLDLWPSDFKVVMVTLAPRMDVCTEFEDLVRSRRYRVIDWKRLQTDRQTDRPTCAKQYALSSSKVGINTKCT